MKNVMVIGGAGFIGSHLCDALLERGHQVVCVDNLMRGTTNNLIKSNKSERFFFYEKDATETAEMEGLMKGHEIDYVFHLAANSDIQASAKDPDVEFHCTLSTTWSILSAMRKTGVKKLFFASTSAVYGEQCDTLLSESTTLLQPVSYYGAAKMASEAMIHAFAHMNDMDVCVFRFPNVIGPRLTHGVIFDFIHKLEANPGRLDVLGNGTQSKPYLHVADLVRGILQQCEAVKGVEIFNLGVESETSVSRIAEIVRSEMQLPDAEICYGSSNIGWKGDVPHFQFCLDKIYQTGWRASMSSDDAVVATVKEVLSCRR